MKNCPKCKKISQTDTECSECGVVFADIRNTNGSKEIDLYCPFNDHGQICGKRGSISDSTLGAGPWYCSEHYWQLKRPPAAKERSPMPQALKDMLKPWTSAYGTEPRERQPGEDEDYQP